MSASLFHVSTDKDLSGLALLTGVRFMSVHHTNLQRVESHIDDRSDCICVLLTRFNKI